ncbi:MAG TPA: FGGY family carbohydrate kinase, partial [Steroidobacteraceae bacterium]
MSDAAPQPLTLGLDLGTSAVKIVALGFNDAVIGEAAASFSTTATLAGQAEQHPGDWLQAASRAMRALDQILQSALGADWTRQIASIGLTG